MTKFIPTRPATQSEYHPPVDVPADVLQWVRDNGHRFSFAASMWNVYQRTGGLTARQLEMCREMMEK